MTAAPSEPMAATYTSVDREPATRAPPAGSPCSIGRRRAPITAFSSCRSRCPRRRRCRSAHRLIAPHDRIAPDHGVPPHDGIAPHDRVAPHHCVPPDHRRRPRRLVRSSVSPTRPRSPHHRLGPTAASRRATSTLLGRRVVSPALADRLRRIDPGRQLDGAVRVESRRRRPSAGRPGRRDP